MSSTLWNRALIPLSMALSFAKKRLSSCLPSQLSAWTEKASRTESAQTESAQTEPTRGAYQTPLADHISVGSVGETLALMHLQPLGFKLIEKNFRILGGELDLIMLDRDWIVFVEVKSLVTRGNDDPAEAVDQRKQRVLTRSALAYLKQRGWLERAARFDVVTVQFAEHPKRYMDATTQKIDWNRLRKTDVRIAHYRHAFEAMGDSLYG